MKTQILPAAVALLATTAVAAPAPGQLPSERSINELNERSLIEARANLLSGFACIPYNIIVNAVNILNPAGRASASAFCAAEVASTVTVTRTSVVLSTRTNFATIPGTAVITNTAAGPAPIITVTVPVVKVASTNSAAVVSASGTASAAPPTYTNCDQYGWDRSGDDATLRAYSIDSSGTYSTFAACQGLCKSDSKCATFGYGDKYCFLYAKYPGVYENSASPYRFFDAYCPQPANANAGASTNGNSKRQLSAVIPARPALFNGLSDAMVDGACSCLVPAAPAITSEVVVTQVSTVLQTVQTNVFVATRTVIALTTPPAVTVTLQL